MIPITPTPTPTGILCAARRVCCRQTDTGGTMLRAPAVSYLRLPEVSSTLEGGISLAPTLDFREYSRVYRSKVFGRSLGVYLYSV